MKNSVPYLTLLHLETRNTSYKKPIPLFRLALALSTSHLGTKFEIWKIEATEILFKLAKLLPCPILVLADYGSDISVLP